MASAKQFLKKNTMLIALIFVAIIFQITTQGVLLLPGNVTNLIAQNGHIVILAVGMLICILTGGNIDLSVGSIVALVGAIAGKLIVVNHNNIYLSMLLCLVAGLAIGSWHGFWIAYVRIPAFIVTLSGMLIWRGIARIVLDGLTISPFPTDMTRYFYSFIPDFMGGMAFGDKILNSVALVTGLMICVVFVLLQLFSRASKVRKGYAAEHIAVTIGKCVVIILAVAALAFTVAQDKGLPAILVLLAIVVAVYGYFTVKTVYGRHIYALGGNEKAAKLSGINTNKMLFFAYANMGFLSALAALVCVSRFNSAAPTSGSNYELDAIGACFIGGASAYGGTGTVGGAVIGAIFMGVLNNGMSIMGIDSDFQLPIKGLVLLIAVAIGVISKIVSTFLAKNKGRTA
ncbi:MAG: sugar ABC transporter permease [Clostridiales bacterium]|jgi:putative multiple sugar transport system permease protein|nr:sugar ABC transporter permease [Clostridiales bacterium]